MNDETLADAQARATTFKAAMKAAQAETVEAGLRAIKILEQNASLQQKVDELRALTTELTGNLMVLKLRGNQNGD